MRPFLTFVYIIVLICSCKDQKDIANGVSLEEINNKICTQLGEHWRIEKHSFGYALSGSIKIANDSNTFNKAGVLICDITIDSIQNKLINENYQAPFRIIGKSKHFQIVSWSESEKVKLLVKEIDRIDF
jgi:hypothetical protein